MMTYGMTDAEILREANRDNEWMINKVSYILPKIRRHLIKTKAYPFQHVIKCKSEHNNDSIIIISVKDKQEFNKCFRVQLIQKWNREGGQYLVSTDPVTFKSGMGGWACSIYTPHCQKRYAQRVYEEVGERAPQGDDLIIDMFTSFSPSECSAANPAKNREGYSQYDCVMCDDKCVFFGITSYNKKSEKVVTWCTCLRYDQLNEKQSARVDKNIDTFKDMKDEPLILTPNNLGILR